jgi:hypothetical protein
VPVDDGGSLVMAYKDYVDVLSKESTEALPPHRATDHAIDLEPGIKLPYGQVYNLSEVELRALKAYIETNLAKEIRRSLDI